MCSATRKVGADELLMCFTALLIGSADLMIGFGRLLMSAKRLLMCFDGLLIGFAPSLIGFGGLLIGFTRLLTASGETNLAYCRERA